MKKFALAVVFVFLLAGLSFAQTGELDPDVTLSVPVATHIQIRNIQIKPSDKVMVVNYRWLGTNGQPIQIRGYAIWDLTWTCQDIPGFDPANCTGVGVPHECCTGVGTGSGCPVAVTDFTDIFGFVIRQQDVGTKLGKGLRDLLVNKMRQSIPALSGVTITFSD